jgi:hypothetical protein
MRRILVCVAAVIALDTIAAFEIACSRDKETVQAADAPIAIETSQMFVTIQNRAGGPLLDLTIAIQTPGTTFTHLVRRLEAGQKHDVSLSSFSSRDGTTFNLRFVRPKVVLVTATDLTSKKYESQVPWK